MKAVGKILPLVVLIFIALGDRFLPQPLSGYSFQTRTSINQFIVGLFPKKDLKNPYQKSDDAVQQAEDEVRRSGGKKE